MIVPQYDCTFCFPVRDNRFFTECAQVRILSQSPLYSKVSNSETRGGLYGDQCIISEESKLLYFSLTVKSKYKSGGCLLIIEGLDELLVYFELQVMKFSV